MTITLPKGAKYIIEKLNENGYEAYIVGGCVRDSILGETPKDWDITTSAKPEEVMNMIQKLCSKQMFRDGIIKITYMPTGIVHGTITITIDFHADPSLPGARESYEITTYRVDGEYSDGRHPDKVEFTSSLEEDLSRRDFTINAMAYHPDKGLIDYFDGQLHLEKRVIRCVGDSELRFEEDRLRMLRAVRFASKLDFKISCSTISAIVKNADKITVVSAERIHDELVKILLANPYVGLDMLKTMGLLEHVLPDIHACIGVDQNNPYHQYDVFWHTMYALNWSHAHRDEYMNDIVVKLALLFHDTGKVYTKVLGEDGYLHFYGHSVKSEEIVRAALMKLKFSNDIIDRVCLLVQEHDCDIASNKRSIRRCIIRLGDPELFPLLLAVKAGDCAAHKDGYTADKNIELDKYRSIYGELMLEQKLFKVTDLAVNGHDVMAAGYKGKEIGTILNGLLDLVVDEVVDNDREKLLRLIKFRQGI